MEPISAVILDLDGLMIDTERAARKAWRRAARHFGYTMNDTLFARLSGRKAEDGRRIMFDTLGEDFPYAEVRQRRDKYLIQAFHRGEIGPMPGLYDLLKTIDALALDAAIATSGSREITPLKLSALELDERFDVVVCAEDVEHGKPAPDIFLEAARQLDVPPSRCVVLEDSDAGARAAHAAGMRVIVIPEFEDPAEDVQSIAWRVLPSLHEAADHLAEAVERKGQTHAQPAASD
ncbi:MAG: HAD family hydrolase [Chloroflexota bacterium]